MKYVLLTYNPKKRLSLNRRSVSYEYINVIYISHNNIQITYTFF